MRQQASSMGKEIVVFGTISGWYVVILCTRSGPCEHKVQQSWSQSSREGRGDTNTALTTRAPQAVLGIQKWFSWVWQPKHLWGVRIGMCLWNRQRVAQASKKYTTTMFIWRYKLQHLRQNEEVKTNGQTNVSKVTQKSEFHKLIDFMLGDCLISVFHSVSACQWFHISEDTKACKW